METVHDNVTQSKEAIKPAKMFALRLLNSDYVMYECVVDCLIEGVGISPEHVSAVVQTAHRSGSATLGTYTKDVAETKASIAMDKLREIHVEKTGEEPTEIFDVIELDDE